MGGWEKGKKHGKGTYTYASGSKYEGEFTDGTMTVSYTHLTLPTKA